MNQISFFDANCMIGRWPGSRLWFSTAVELAQEMKYYHIEKALVYHSWAWQYDPEKGNAQLLREIKGHKNLFPVMVIAPWQIPQQILSKETRELIKTKAYGVKLFPKDHNYSLCSWNFKEIFKFLEKIHLPVFINYNQVDMNNFAEILSLYPHLPFILCETSYSLGRMLFSLLNSFSNLYFEISTFLCYEGIEEVCARFGAQRVLFGSAMPFLDPGGSLARLLYSTISEKDRKRIAGTNLERLISGIKR